MQLACLKSTTLKTKLALAVASLFVLFVTAASFFSLSYFERTFKESISTQKFSHVSSLANSIDDKLRIAQNSLMAVASIVPPDALADADRAQRFLDNRTGILTFFDSGIFLISREGRLVAESPYKPGHRGKDLSSLEYFQKTVTSGKPHVSGPLASINRPGRPAVVLSVPLFDSRGRMTGMMAGSFDLMGRNILADLCETRIGKGGYLYITDSNRTMIVHPDRGKIMKPAGPPGSNRLYEQALKGFDGSGETVTSNGVQMLSSFKHLAMTPWILGANYPTSEAYAPLVTARRYFAVAAVTATSALLLITWLIMRRLMAPLAAFTRHVEHLPEKRGEERQIAIAAMDEIGVLETAFNTMLNTLDRQQESLMQREEMFRLLADFTSDWEYWINPGLRVVYSSPSCLAVTGYQVEEFLNSHVLLFEIVHPDDRKAHACHVESARMLQEVNLNDVTDIEFRIVTRQGEIRWLSHVCRPIFGRDGAFMGRRASNRDITERKRAEEKLREQALLLEEEVRERQGAQEALAVKQQQLEALNSSLEERIMATVGEIRRKDQMLIQQSRQAAMGEMINNIAHQWRQPLNNVGLIVQDLMYRCENGELTREGMRRDVNMAMDTIRFMSRTIDDFREFFRRDKEKQAFPVNDTLNRAIGFVSAGLRYGSIAVDIEAVEDVTAYGYPNEYSQVLLNILNNARDVLTERGVSDPRIRIRVFRENDRAVVTIRDNGGGIDEDVLPRIFDPYFSTKEPGKGTGIGLYMSKVIVEQNMGGLLSARSIDNGAEFRIELLST